MRPRLGLPSRAPRWIAAPGATLLVALLAATAAPAAAGGRAPALAHSSASIHVDIHEFAFHPHTLTVARGTRIVFANGDPIAHTATGSDFATGHIHPGHAVAVEFDQRGVFAYHCSIHPFMHGKIVVR
jgi:plastocyanin